MTPPALSCAACGAPGPFAEYCRADFLPGDGRHLLSCPACDLTFLWPQPTPAELGAYYSQSYYDFNRGQETGKGWAFARRLRRRAPRGRFLDIGCATGFFLAGIQQRCAWELFGLETGREAAAYARRSTGLEIRDVPLEEAGYPDDFFDVLHLNNVLEHTLSPDRVLAEARRILKPGGLLFVSVPNGHIDRLGYRKVLELTGRPGASKDGHLFFFTGKALQNLVDRCGLAFGRIRSSGYKRGFRVLGLWPEKKGWVKAYQGRADSPRTVEDSITEGRTHPEAYYHLKHALEDLLQMPGFSSSTYDFNLQLLKPAPRDVNGL